MGLAAKIIKGLGPLESKIEIWMHKYAGILFSTPVRFDRIEVNDLTIELPHLPEEFSGYRLLQLSDIHMGTWMTPKRLRDIVAYANSFQADLIVITGDFVGHNAAIWEEDLVETLKELQAKDGILAIMGNHDHWTDIAVIRRLLQRSGIVELRNDTYTIERQEERLTIGGVDDCLEAMDDLDRVLSRVAEGDCLILLAHEPDYADISAATGRIDLQLSGHSHGGQMILPLIGPAVRIPMAEKYPLGLYEINGMWQYTNRGLGTGIVPVRINCPQEITIFDLQPVN